MDIAYLYRQAALEPSKAFGKRPSWDVECSLRDSSLHFITSSSENLNVQGNKRPLRIPIAYEVFRVPKSSTFYFVESKKPGLHKNFVDIHKKACRVWPIDDVCRVFQYAVWHMVFTPFTSASSPVPKGLPFFGRFFIAGSVGC